jgi:hypothetical protein
MFRATMCSSSVGQLYNCINTTSGIITVCYWPSGRTTTNTVVIPVVVLIQLSSSWGWAQSCLKHVEDSYKHIIEEILPQVGYLRLGLPNVLFPSDFLTNNVSHSPGYLILYCITRILFGDKYKSRISSLRSFLQYPLACSIGFLFLEYPQPMFLPRCDRPSFTDINNVEKTTI